MKNIDSWGAGIFALVLGLVHLILAAHATDAFFQFVGLAIFGFSYVFALSQINAAYDNH